MSRFLAATVAVLSLTGMASALTWTHANTPDASDTNVMALIHFDEGTGTSATNASILGGDDLKLTDGGMWYANGVLGSAITVSGSGASAKSAWTDFDGDGVNEVTNSNQDRVIPWNAQNGMTVSFWTRVDAASAPPVSTDDNKAVQQFYSSTSIWHNIYSGVTTDQYGGMRVRPGAGRWMSGSGTNTNLQSLNSRLADGQWHHLAVVYDTTPIAGTNFGDWKLYVDNELIYSDYANGVCKDASGNNIGPGPNGGGMDLVAGTYNWAYNPTTQTWRQDLLALTLGGNNGANGIELDEFFMYNGVLSDFSNGFGAPEPGDHHPGDANGDGVVTDADYTLWADNYNATNATWNMGDFNKDGLVSDADYTIWADHYGHTNEDPVPEPATLSLLGLGLLGLIRRRG